MLVLTRSTDEEIRIGDDIVVRVLDVKGDRVRLGIAAPSHVSVHRQEVYQEIERANREALAIAGSGLAGARKLVEESAHSRAEGDARKKETGKKLNTEVGHGT